MGLNRRLALVIDVGVAGIAIVTTIVNVPAKRGIGSLKVAATTTTLPMMHAMVPIVTKSSSLPLSQKHQQRTNWKRCYCRIQDEQRNGDVGRWYPFYKHYRFRKNQ